MRDAILQDDKFSKSAMFIGPAENKNPFGGTIRTWRLRSWIDKSTLQVTHQLYVDIHYGSDWRWYERAADDHARDLPVTKISSNVDGCVGSAGCTLSETVGIALSDEELRAAATSGMEIKLWARSGDTLVLPITAAQIQGQLSPVMTYMASFVAATIGARAAGASPAPTEPGVVVLGANFTDTRPDFAKAVGAGDLGCVLVAVVRPDSVAQHAGLLVGDCVVQYAGHTVKAVADLGPEIRATTKGQKIDALVVRGGRRVPLQLQY